MTRLGFLFCSVLLLLVACVAAVEKKVALKQRDSNGDDDNNNGGLQSWNLNDNADGSSQDKNNNDDDNNDDKNDNDKRRRNGNSNIDLKNLNIAFAKEFAQFNPNSKSSAFMWNTNEIDGNTSGSCVVPGDVGSDSGTVIISNNAAFQRRKNVVQMSSLPYGRWVDPKAGVNASQTAYDGSAQSDALNLERNEVLSVSLTYGCETVGTEYHPYPKSAVQDAKDDPRLAGCAVYFADSEGKENGMEFGIHLTNKGMWAVYSRSPITRYALKAPWKAFFVFRRIGDRTGRLEDVRITLDNGENEVSYYVGTDKVWTVRQIGLLSKVLEDSRNKLLLETEGIEQVAKVKQTHLFIENDKILDLADPNRSGSSDSLRGNRALSRYTKLRGYYGKQMRFVDNNGRRKYQLFNQGSIMSLSSVRVSSSSNNNRHNDNNDYQ